MEGNLSAERPLCDSERFHQIQLVACDCDHDSWVFDCGWGGLCDLLIRGAGSVYLI